MSLSGRSYFFTGAIVLLGILGQWTGGMLESLWRFPAALWVCAIIFEGFFARRQPLSLERRVNARLSLGHASGVDIRVDNPGLRWLNLETQACYPTELLGEQRLVAWKVAPGATLHRAFTITPVCLGATSLGPLYIRVLGRLGLVWWSKKMAASQSIDVIPHLLADTQPGTATAKIGAKQILKVSASGHDLLALRDYQPGDPLHAIDWKATARSQRPTVRVYAQEQHMDLVLVVDAGRSSQLQAGQLSRLHHYVNVAAGLAELAIRQGDRVGIVSFADEVLGFAPMDGGMRALRSLRGHLQQLRSQPREFNPLAAALFLRGMLQHRSLVVFLTEIEEKEAATQLVQATSLLVPKHTPLIASLVDETIDALQRRVAKHWLDPYRSYAALEYSRALRRTAMHLQRLGAVVVRALPDRLAPTVLQQYRHLRERRRV